MLTTESHAEAHTHQQQFVRISEATLRVKERLIALTLAYNDLGRLALQMPASLDEDDFSVAKGALELLRTRPGGV